MSKIVIQLTKEQAFELVQHLAAITCEEDNDSASFIVQLIAQIAEGAIKKVNN